MIECIGSLHNYLVSAYLMIAEASAECSFSSYSGRSSPIGYIIIMKILAIIIIIIIVPGTINNSADQTKLINLP